MNTTSSRTRYYNLCYILAFILLFVTINNYFTTTSDLAIAYKAGSSDVKPFDIVEFCLTNLTSRLIILGVLVAAIAKASLVASTFLIIFVLYMLHDTSYFTDIEIFRGNTASFLYILLNFISSYFITRFFFRKSSLISKPLVVLLCNTIIFLFVLFIIPFSLLAFHSLNFNNICIVTAVLALSLFIINKKTNCEIYGELNLKHFLSSKTCWTGALTAVLSLWLLFILLQAKPLTFDENKAYLALAKFYAEANKLFLTEIYYREYPAYAFPHFQEIIFSGGYILNGGIGIKTLAALIEIFKFFSIFLFSFLVFKLPKKYSYFSCLLYLIIPYLFTLSTTVRLENLLTFTLLSVIILSQEAKEQDNPKEKSLLVIFSIFLLTISCSSKYTGLYICVISVLFYFKEFWTVIIRNYKKFLLSYGFLFILCAALSLFWYIRNIALFGQLLSMEPIGKAYHLTKNFPPLGSINDIYLFLLNAFVFPSPSYTETTHFAYGFFGFLFFPTLFLALGDKKYRNASLMVFMYLFLLCISTRQIRYASPVFPIVLAIFSDLMYKFHKRYKLSTNSLLSIALVPFVFCYYNPKAESEIKNIFNKPTEVLKRDIRSINPDLTEINKVLDKSDLVIGSENSIYYEIKSKYLSAPFWSFKDFCNKKIMAKYKYMLVYDLTDHATGKERFDDLRYDPNFMSFISDLELKANHYHLYKPKLKLIHKLCRQVRKFDEGYLFVSEEKIKTMTNDEFNIVKKVHDKKTGKNLILIGARK